MVTVLNIKQIVISVMYVKYHLSISFLSVGLEQGTAKYTIYFYIRKKLNMALMSLKTKVRDSPCNYHWY